MNGRDGGGKGGASDTSRTRFPSRVPAARLRSCSTWVNYDAAARGGNKSRRRYLTAIVRPDERGRERGVCRRTPATRKLGVARSLARAWIFTAFGGSATMSREVRENARVITQSTIRKWRENIREIYHAYRPATRTRRDGVIWPRARNTYVKHTLRESSQSCRAIRLA